MSRKEKIVVVPDDWGRRDKGKHYLIREMNAEDAEWWFVRALLMLRKSGERLPDSLEGHGMEFIALFGINVLINSDIDPEKLRPLLDELLGCVKIVRDPNARDQRGNPIALDIVSPDDIAEVKTRLWLRSEVLDLHLGFSPAEGLWTLASKIQIWWNNLADSKST